MGKRLNPGSNWQLMAYAIIVQLFCSYIWGLDPQKSVDRYLVNQWEMVDGLPSNTVLSINQTADGYLWIGTSKGLVRFDGVKFVPLRFAEKEEIYLQKIRDIFVGKEGTLWLGGSGGLTLYRYRTGQSKNFTKDHGITIDGIRRIYDDLKGNIWISFDASYVHRFSNGKFTAFNASHGLSGKKINAIIEDRKGNLLFGTLENGVFTYKDGKFFKYSVKGLEAVSIRTMYEDSKGILWIGTNKGLFRVTGKDTGKYTLKDGLTDDYVTQIREDNDHNVWIGTMKGLNRVKKRRDGTVGFDSLLESFTIMCIFEDREKSLWIGTDHSGIKRLKDGKFVSFEPFAAIPQEIPLSLFEDRRGDTWIGTVSGKLFRFRDSRFIESLNPRELAGTGITAIAGDGKGNLWLGTIGKGIFQKKKDTVINFTTGDGLADNTVTSIFRDSRNNLWFSTFDGVSVLRSRNNIIESLKPGDDLSGKKVYNVYEDRSHDIWIAAEKGITILKDGEFAKKGMTKYLQGIPVVCIYEDVDSSALTGSVFWIATHGDGLKRFRQGEFFHYTTAHGMTTNFIYQFFEDRQGNFWLMSDSGILRVNKTELNQFAEGRADIINCTSFGISDGLKSPGFDNEYSRNSALKDGNGEFWFITKKGISILDPGKVRRNTVPPPVVIEEVFFNGQAIPRPWGNLPAFKGITDASFHFTAPTFLSPGKVRFKYRLEQKDSEWILLQPGQGRAAHYKDLAPGTYTFGVTACNSEGFWNQSGDSVTFILKPLFHQTILFRLAVVLLIIGLAGAAVYLYKKKKQSVEKKERYKGAPLNSSFTGECIKKLDYLMDIEKIYCNADITLQSLAEKMSIAPYQLSQLLNEKLNRSFADYINSYRIEEVKKILQTRDGARRKISAIAIEVGFNTMAAFYKAFKKHTDTTPTQYKKRSNSEEKKRPSTLPA